MKQAALNHQHNELPTNRFDARLSEELEERVEFLSWTESATVSSANGGTVSATVSHTSK